MLRPVSVMLFLVISCSAFAAENMVQVWISTQDGAKSMSQEKPLSLEKVKKSKAPVIMVDPAKTGQAILGLGASFEHATCENLMKLPQERREEVIAKLVSPETGIGMNLMRLSIGASDFIGEPYYSYCDLPEGQTDPELTKFSIEKDKACVLPVVQTALAKNPNLLFFASCWSAPGWMKSTGKQGGGRLLPEFYGAYANYIYKFIRAYEAEGVPIHAVTVQNEPRMEHPEYPTTLWTGEEERDFIRDHLGPLFRKNNVKSFIWCFDHNWSMLDYPRAVMSDPQAAQYVEGTAFHLYEGRVDAQTTFRDEFPDKNIYFTEGSVFRARGACQLANILRHWSRSYNGWVVMLDEHRKPNRGPHSASATCIELLDDGAVRYNFDYYMYGQFMRFIQRGAVRVESTAFEGRTLANVVFRNPNGEFVMVAANATREPFKFVVQCQDKMFQTELPGNAVGTFAWPTAP